MHVAAVLICKSFMFTQATRKAATGDQRSFTGCVWSGKVVRHSRWAEHPFTIFLHISEPLVTRSAVSGAVARYLDPQVRTFYLTAHSPGEGTTWMRPGKVSCHL